MSLVPVGIRLRQEVIDELVGDGRRLGEVVREAVDAYLAGPPELMGTAEAARVLGVATGNFGKLKGLPEPVYRLQRGALYDAEQIREFARERGAR